MTRPRRQAGGLDGRVVLVTGATEGIGRAAAASLAAQGATLTLIGRSRDKAERTVQWLKETAGNANVHCLVGDLSRPMDVATLASAFRARHDRLDVLVNNAGAFFRRYTVSADGLEMTFALNHLAYFGLTHQLFDLVASTANARVVNTASTVYRLGRLDLQHLAQRDGRSGFQAYCDSKLANVVFTQELARRLAPYGATANCMHPGFTRTGFGRNTTGLMVTLMQNRPVAWFARTPEQGADTLVWLASSLDASGVTGQYVFNRRVAPARHLFRARTSGPELWDWSEALFSQALRAGGAGQPAGAVAEPAG